MILLPPKSHCIHFHIHRMLGFGVAVWLVFTSWLIPTHASEGPDFFREVRPILAKACFQCHGPDEETRAADLRLDVPDGLFGTQNGHRIVVKGDIQHSELIHRIFSTDPDEQMPPADSGRSLSDLQKQTLVRWIESGAPWEQHWAFTAPQKPPVPEVSGSEFAAWAKSEIDRFILAKQMASGLSPSPVAEPEILVRRMFLDLIGLPPAIDEADQWIEKLRTASDSASAHRVCEKLADHLLARPEYGERWARSWLDLARYADTNGYEKDRPRSIWPYRDWVIQALNEDMPFDQFTIEQIAGDMLPNSTRSQKIATGFHRNTMLNEEGGIDPLEFRFHAMTDRVATTGTTWLGLTTGCAQCHTHKYDPLTHREYYQLMAFLNNADEPSLALPDADADSRIAENLREAARLLEELPSHWPHPAFQSVNSKIQRAVSTGGESLAVSAPNTVTPAGPLPERTTYVLELSLNEPTSFSALQLEVFTPKGKRGPGRAQNGNFVLSEVEVSLVTSVSTAEPASEEVVDVIPVISVSASAEQANYLASFSIDGRPETGWAVDTGNGVPDKVTATFILDKDAVDTAMTKAKETTAGKFLRVRLIQNLGDGHFLGTFRLSLGRTLTTEEIEHERSEIVQKTFSAWLDRQRRTAVNWQTLRPTSATSNMPHLSIQSDGSILAMGDTTKQDHYEVHLASTNEPITAIRLEVLPDVRLPGNGPGTTYYEGSLGDFYLNELSVHANNQPVRLRSATESYAKNKFGNTPVSAALTLDGDVQTGWSVAGQEGQRHTAVYLLEQPVPARIPLTIRMIFGRHFASSLGRFRFSAASSSDREPVAKRLSDLEEQLLAKADSDLSDSDRQQLFHAFLLNAPELSARADRIRQLQAPPDMTTTLILQERPGDNPRRTFRHHRGEYLQPREEVSAMPPELLHSWPADRPHNRLGFAQWLVDRSNPLTARVIANRQWAAFFGRGIVSTVDDFGVQGTAPTHPELLDWLAVTFMDEDQWSLKKLHRRIVLSATYRQSAARREDAVASDPDNQLLSFAPRFRFDAEIVRDSIVQSAGVLSKKRGGPPVRPLQPPGITEVAFGSPQWDVSSGEDRYRRSVYTFIKRTAPFAMITTFDGPSGEACVARRTRSNTPLQALTLLNDPMLIDLARASGGNLMRLDSRSDTDRITHLFRQLLTRSPDDEELSMLTEFVDRHREHFTEHPQLATEIIADSPISSDCSGLAEQATWTALSRVLFALDEVVMRP